MPMTQTDIREHYETLWQEFADRADDDSQLQYGGGAEDEVLYPIYEQLVRDHRITVDGGRVLDVGSGSGRWIRFLLQRYRPTELLGIDHARASVDLNRRFADAPDEIELSFAHADITDRALNVGGPFDLINVANVLFHIPEPDLFAQALANLARLAGPTGRIVTTEYLPRATMRTEWMLVRSRYDFEHAVRSAGLRIVDVRACSFFANDPMGLDGPDHGLRNHFHRVRAGIKQILGSNLDAGSRRFFIQFVAGIDQALLAYCRERLADIDLPSQKLVLLEAVGSQQ